MPDYEYEVVWDGVNDGKDGDLLNPSRRIEEKAEGKKPRQNYQAAVLAAMEHARDWLTMAQIAAACGYSMNEINAVVYHLRVTGRLVRTTDPVSRSRYGRDERGYALPNRFQDVRKGI